VDRNDYQNCHPFTFPKMINLEEDSPVGEDSPEAEDFQEVEDTQEEEEYHLEDHQVEAGDHCHHLYHKTTKESW